MRFIGDRVSIRIVARNIQISPFFLVVSNMLNSKIDSLVLVWWSDVSRTRLTACH